MAPSLKLAAAVPLAKAVVADDDVRDQLRRAVTAGRTALRPAPRPTRLRRAGLALREAGDVITRAGARAEKRRRAQRRKTVLQGGLVAGVAGAGAVLLNRRGA